MAATTLRPLPHFSDENPTPRSFSPLPPPSRPSLEASSMKSRKSFLDILSSARRVAAIVPSAPSGSKLRQEAKLTEDVATSCATEPNRGTQNKQIPAAQKQEAPSPVSNPSQPLRSRSRTILRVISTKFRSRSPLSPTSPPPNTSLQAKQNREAALRERGLLPPLEPNKDLSKQEAEQDRRIPIVPHDSAPVDETATPSAADLVKREWEAKNVTPPESPQADERERMNSFRFGGMSPKPSELARTSELETLEEVNTPQPSPSISDATSPPPLPPKDAPSKASSHRSARSTDQGKLEPHHIPLPPSPLPTPLPTPPPTPSRATSRRSTSIASAASPPPSSFHFPRHGDAESSSSIHTRSGSIPRKSTSSAPPPTGPSLHINSPSDSSSTSPALSIPHRRSESLSQMPSISESVSSIFALSSDSPSHTATTISTLNTVDSLAAVAAGANNTSGAKGKNNMLKVKTHEHALNIPMIIESPVEDGIVAEPMSAELGTVPEEIPLPLSPISETHSPSSLTVPSANLLPVRRGRGLTDPERGTQRKSFNPFKRTPSQGASSQSDKSGRIGPPQLKKVSASLTNLRKAASSFKRPKSEHDAASVAPSRASTTFSGRTYDASHLPPSPTLPSQFAGFNHGAGSGMTGVGLRPPRRPVDPTLHSRGSILMETNAIQDDEVRRVTELAFLG